MSLSYDHKTVTYVKNSIQDLITCFGVKIVTIHTLHPISGVKKVKFTHSYLQH